MRGDTKIPLWRRESWITTYCNKKHAQAKYSTKKDEINSKQELLGHTEKHYVVLSEFQRATRVLSG